MIGNFSCVLWSADFFTKSSYQKILSGIPSVSNSLDSDQAQQFVWPNLGPNCLQRLTADDTGKLVLK